MKYRHEIDGLRAVSVAGVVLFHYGLVSLPGGFVGVDVFFVISGYLITRIICDDLIAGKFSIISFYDRRARRILPAALLVILVTVVAGVLFLLPGEYAELGESAVYAAGFLANVFFFENTGYFDQEADLLPLLHYWSLSVEEQFYVFWPILLCIVAFFFHKSARAMAVLTAAIIVLCFAGSVIMVRYDPKAAFYLPHARAWELGLGALFVFLPSLAGRPRLLQEAADMAGLILIAGSMFWITADTPFPGAAALPSCLGAALIIWPKGRLTGVGRILAIPPMRLIGQISYSLYLWHWPILVYCRHYLHGDMPEPAEAGALIGLALVLSWLSWRFVEQPFRRRTLSPPRTIAVGAVAMAAIIMVGGGLWLAKGIPQRFAPEVAGLGGLDVMWQWDCPRAAKVDGLEHAECEFGVPWDMAATKGFLWGDSHAQAVAPLLDVAAHKAGASMILYRACPAILGGKAVYRYRPDLPSYRPLCDESRAQAVRFLKSHPEVNLVVLQASWTNVLRTLVVHGPEERSREHGLDLMRQALTELIPEISRPGRRIVLFGDIPQWNGDPDSPRSPVSCAVAASSSLLLKPCAPGQFAVASDAYERFQGPTFAVFQDLAGKFPGVEAIALGRSMCEGREECVAYLNGEFLYRDTGHLRRNLMAETKNQFAESLNLSRVFIATPRGRSVVENDASMVPAK